MEKIAVANNNAQIPRTSTSYGVDDPTVHLHLGRLTTSSPTSSAG